MDFQAIYSFPIVAYTLGFDVSQSNVTENLNNVTIVSLRTAEGSSTEIPIVIQYIVNGSSIAIPGKGYLYVYILHIFWDVQVSHQ